MGYKEKAEVVFVVKSIWTGVVSSARYVSKTQKYLHSQLKPDTRFLYKNSLNSLDGFNLEMVDYRVDREDNNEYPDW